MNGIQKGHGCNSWLIQPYQDLLSEILFTSDTNFKLQPVALLNKEGELIAGEIGYRIGKVYTSLTGFMDRSNPDHNHAGKLQMYLLAKYLQEEGIQFWNLGHPGMQYKLDLGAEILPRNQFLSMWEKHVID